MQKNKYNNHDDTKTNTIKINNKPTCQTAVRQINDGIAESVQKETIITGLVMGTESAFNFIKLPSMTKKVSALKHCNHSPPQALQI